MATVNLKELKIPSEENLRLLSSLIVSLANKQSSIENKCIKPWVGNETYQKNISYVSYNGYIWLCCVTNNDTEFTENHWVKLADNIIELSKEDIEALINLSPEEITNMQSFIDDSGISTTHTNSSSKIYMSIQAAIAECKNDTIKQIAKKVSGSYKIGQTISDVTSTEFIYLIENGSNYDLYVLVDNVPKKVGDTSIDLSEYLKTTDAESIYLKKTDAEGVYAKISQLDGKIDKKNILSVITSNATNEQLYGARAIFDTFNVKAEKINIFEIPDEETGKSKHLVVDLPAINSISGNTTRLFLTDNIMALGLQCWEGPTLSKDYRAKLFPSSQLLIGYKLPTILSSKINFSNADSSYSYCVVDGICYVNIWSMNILTEFSVEPLIGDLPKAKIHVQALFSNATGDKTVAMGWMSAGGTEFICNSRSAGTSGYTRFSYPIMEDWVPTV